MEEDGPENLGQEPTVLKNESPEFVTNTFTTVILFLQHYGWFLLLGVIVLLYIKSKMSPTIQKLTKKMEDNYAKKKFDPDVAHRRLESMEFARRRLQEQHDAQAAKFAEEQKIKEEEKRKEKIEDWDRHQQGKGYRSKVKPKEEEQQFLKPKKKPTLKQNDYNPLMGDVSGGACYRPPRRGGGGG